MPLLQMSETQDSRQYLDNQRRSVAKIIDLDSYEDVPEAILQL